VITRTERTLPPPHLLLHPPPLLLPLPTATPLRVEVGPVEVEEDTAVLVDEEAPDLPQAAEVADLLLVAEERGVSPEGLEGPLPAVVDLEVDIKWSMLM